MPNIHDHPQMSHLALHYTSIVINVLAGAHKKFQRGQHSEIYLTLKEQDKSKMNLPLNMVSKHPFWHLSARLPVQFHIFGPMS